MKILPNFRIGKWEFEAQDEEPGVLIVLILLVTMVAFGAVWSNGDAPEVGADAHAEAHE